MADEGTTSERPKRPGSSPEHMAKMRAARSQKRLVANPDRTINVDGQTLTHVERVAVEEEPPSPKSIEDVIRRHTEREEPSVAPPAVEERDTEPPSSEIEEEDDNDDDEFPSVAELAAKAEIYSSELDIIPPPEPDPRKRTVPSVGPIDLTKDAPDFSTDTKPKTFLDLFSSFDFDSGNYAVYVQRTLPKAFQGVFCSGVQRPITRRMSLAEFGQRYGGHEYQLTVYGPPRRGFQQMGPDGKLQMKALTDPIRFTFPGPPNLNSVAGGDDDDDGGYMEPGLPHTPGRATNADAKIFETKLQSEEKAELRREHRTERRRIEEAEERRLAENTALAEKRLLAEQRERDIERQREDAERLIQIQKEHQREKEEIMERMNARQQNDPALFNLLGKLIERGGSDDKPLAELAANHRAEVTEINRLHAGELQRAEERVREERQRSDRLVQEAERRAEERIKAAESRAEERIKAFEERAERRITDMQRQFDKDVDTARRDADLRVQAEDRSHQRDLENIKANAESRLTSEKSGFELRLGQKTDEINRLRDELERVRREAAETKDIGKQLEKIKANAALLGMSESSGEEAASDWKTMGLNILGTVVQNAPEILRSAGEALQSRSRLTPQQVEQIRAQERAAMVQQAELQGGAPYQALPPPLRKRPLPSQARPVFATEDGPSVARGGPLAGNLERRATLPGEPLPQPPMPQPQMQTGAPPQASMFGGDLTASPSVMPAAPPQPQQHPSAPTPSVAPPPQGAASAGGVTPEDLHRIVGNLQQAFEMGMTADTVANLVVTQVGVEQARYLVSQLGPNELMQIIQEQPGGSDSPLVRREGQKYLRELVQQVKKLVQVAAA